MKSRLKILVILLFCRHSCCLASVQYIVYEDQSGKSVFMKVIDRTYPMYDSFSCIGDTNHNGKIEMLQKTMVGDHHQLRAYEMNSEGKFEYQVLMEDMDINNIPAARDVGDGDQDGLMEIIGAAMYPDNFAIFETSNYHCFPDTAIFHSGYINNILGNPIFTDADSDGKMEVFYNYTTFGWGGKILVYENPGNNQYEQVAELPLDPGGPFMHMIVEDIDWDGQNEILTADLDGYMNMWECTGDNQYEMVWTYYDNHSFSCSLNLTDLENDGIYDVIVGGGQYFDNRFHDVIYFFQPEGDNLLILKDTIKIGSCSMSGCRISIADIDQDEFQEIIVSSSLYHYFLKRDETGSYKEFFKSLTGGPAINIADFDHDGRIEMAFNINDMDSMTHSWILGFATPPNPLPWPEDEAPTVELILNGTTFYPGSPFSMFYEISSRSFSGRAILAILLDMIDLPGSGGSYYYPEWTQEPTGSSIEIPTHSIMQAQVLDFKWPDGLGNGTGRMRAILIDASSGELLSEPSSVAFSFSNDVQSPFESMTTMTSNKKIHYYNEQGDWVSFRNSGSLDSQISESMVIRDADADGEKELFTLVNNESGYELRRYAPRGGMRYRVDVLKSGMEDPWIPWDIGNLDGDENPDLLIQRTDHDMTIGELTGNRNHMSLSVIYESEDLNRYFNRMTCLDFNHDGLDDLFMALNRDIGGQSKFEVVKNNGNLQFETLFESRVTYGFNTNRPLLADFDLNGTIDFFVSDHRVSLAAWEIGESAPWNKTLDSPIFGVIQEPRKTAFGDVDGDGYPEIVLAGYSQHLNPDDGFNEASWRVYVLEANNDKPDYPYHIVKKMSFLTPFWTEGDVAIADVNGDGMLEIVLRLGSLVILASDGDDSYYVYFAWNEFGSTVEANDLNNDGSAEVIWIAQQNESTPQETLILENEIALTRSNEMRLTLSLSQTEPQTGDYFELEYQLETPGSLTGVDLYAALEIAGTYFYFPDWSIEPDSIKITIPSAGRCTGSLLSFDWPDTEGTSGEGSFIIALIDKETGSPLVDPYEIGFTF